MGFVVSTRLLFFFSFFPIPKIWMIYCRCTSCRQPARKEEKHDKLNQELHEMTFENQTSSTEQHQQKSAREPAWIKSPVTVIHWFILISLCLSLPPSSQQLHLLIPLSAVLQFLLDGLLLSEREARELHGFKAWENDIENILPSAKFHVPEDITPMQ